MGIALHEGEGTQVDHTSTCVCHTPYRCLYTLARSHVARFMRSRARRSLPSRGTYLGATNNARWLCNVFGYPVWVSNESTGGIIGLMKQRKGGPGPITVQQWQRLVSCLAILLYATWPVNNRHCRERGVTGRRLWHGTHACRNHERAPPKRSPYFKPRQPTTIKS